MKQNHINKKSAKNALIDICTVGVDKNLSREDRITKFVEQIKNPYQFKCGDFIVHAHFDGGVSLEECLYGIIR